jgi:hypothetical protein
VAILALSVQSLSAQAHLPFPWNQPAGGFHTTVIQNPLDSLFSIERDFIQKILEAIPKANDRILGYANPELNRIAKAASEKLEHVNTSTHTDIIPIYSEAGLTFKMIYDEIALKNPKNIVKNLVLMMALTSVGEISSIGQEFKGSTNPNAKREFRSCHSMAELMTNFKAGSPTAKARWTELQIALLKQLELNEVTAHQLQLDPKVLAEIVAELESELPLLKKNAAQFAKSQKNKLDQWKSQTGILENLEAMNEKLDDMIMNNDRRGVRQLLEAYLPWARMEPVEANTWKTWLEVIEYPDLNKATVAFRGVSYDTDKIQRRRTAQGELFGFMSTVLTKNQGSYTRRLRSLTTNREKNGDIGLKFNKTNTPSVKIADQMISHSQNPVASNFLSFTYNPTITRIFMKANILKMIKGVTVSTPRGGILVAKIDSRRMIPNLLSIYDHELELLTPLMVFPDEVIAYHEGSFASDQEFINFIEEISNKTGIDFHWENDGEKNFKQRFSQDGLTFLKKMTEIRTKNNSCNNAFMM